MKLSAADRREAAERRTPADRRAGSDRRAAGERRELVVLVAVERRAGAERRALANRRAGAGRRDGTERRGPDSIGEHLRTALQLLADVAESGALDDESLRNLDTAIFRLRFALDRCEAGRET